MFKDLVRSLYERYTPNGVVQQSVPSVKMFQNSVYINFFYSRVSVAEKDIQVAK